MTFTPEQLEARRAENRRAIARARSIVKPGDLLAFGRCGGTRSHARFTHWEGAWMASKTLDDIAPAAVTRLNGKPIDFNDAGGIPLSDAQLQASVDEVNAWYEARRLAREEQHRRTEELLAEARAAYLAHPEDFRAEDGFGPPIADNDELPF